MTHVVPTIRQTPGNNGPEQFMRDLVNRWLNQDQECPILEELCQALRRDSGIIGGATVANQLEEMFQGRRGLETEILVKNLKPTDSKVLS